MKSRCPSWISLECNLDYWERSSCLVMYLFPRALSLGIRCLLALDNLTRLDKFKKYPNKLGRIAPLNLWCGDWIEIWLNYKSIYVLSLLQKTWIVEKLLEAHWDSLRLIETPWDSLRLLETPWDSLRLLKTHCDSLRLIETHWDSLRLTNWTNSKNLD